MKISKLFHWLYACLMLLPIFAVGITCAYAVFNKNAKDSYSHSEEFTYYEKVQYQTNEVNSVDDFVVGNVYRLYIYLPNQDELISEEINNFIFHSNLLNYSFRVDFSSINVDDLFAPFVYNNDFHNVYFEYVCNDEGVNEFYLRFFSLDDNYISLYFDTLLAYDEINPIYCQFIYTNETFEFNDLTNIQNVFNNGFITSADLSECVPTYIEKTTEISTLDNVFYDSVREVGENPYFSWANDSFLAEPVQYITNLFGMPTDNSVITLLSYWLAISIIYLCFDVIMYIPLLAHRWLDKGILE